jgi:hypothetical protein
MWRKDVRIYICNMFLCAYGEAQKLMNLINSQLHHNTLYPDSEVCLVTVRVEVTHFKIVWYCLLVYALVLSAFTFRIFY